ncbi:hypothetical protein ACFWOB_07395 [Streptomyces sp. NPDC058420]|uniref:effector-associated constant component EACC1 n=1 Tax=Streptomyces sp. NPDC058420 TaxID=3346489 RepID=UPI0036526618
MWTAELRYLWTYLTGRPELRGRVTGHTTDETDTDHLGPLTDALVAALEPGGPAAAAEPGDHLPDSNE